MIQWLFSINPNIDIKDETFHLVCEGGYLAVAQWLLQIKPTIHIYYLENCAFRLTCSAGHLHVAQWLLQVYKEKRQTINISIWNDWCFRTACVHGHLELAKWLLTIKPDIDIKAVNSEAFYYACTSQHLAVAQWLESLNPYLYVINYDEHGKINDYKIREKEEFNWQKRKYLVYIASIHCPEQNRTNLLYRLPSDVSRLVISFV